MRSTASQASGPSITVQRFPMKSMSDTGPYESYWWRIIASGSWMYARVRPKYGIPRRRGVAVLVIVMLAILIQTGRSVNINPWQ